MVGFQVGLLYYAAVVSSYAIVAETVGEALVSLGFLIEGVNV